MSATAENLLDWYDQNAREMAWRVGPKDRKAGMLPDPYHVWLSEIMLQQTTVVTVGPYFKKFLDLWPKIQDLASAKDEDVMAAWAGLGYYARARNLLKCARVVTQEYGGTFPKTEAELLRLPGIGPYTAASLSAIAFDVPSTVLDGNVERVMARLHCVTDPLPGSKEDLRALAAQKTPQFRAGDYAQAVMDLGATVCTPRAPLCDSCPWSLDCLAHKKGVAQDLPRKTPKKPKPTRFGNVFLGMTESGAIILERRPEKGLLGGMLGWPGSDWHENEPEYEPPFGHQWTALNEQVRHTFTHFHLFLTVYVGQVGTMDVTKSYIKVDQSDFDWQSLPTVMRKAYTLAQPHWMEQK